MKIPHVAACGNNLVLVNLSDDLLQKLHYLSLVKREANTYTANVSEYTQEDTATLFNELNALGIAFSYGRDWAPSEIFEYLREKGLLSGKYRRIMWKGPENYVIEER